jgi:hypothetical protein
VYTYSGTVVCQLTYFSLTSCPVNPRQLILVQVTEVNKRWQKYNNDRQMYVQRLLSTIQDQQEQMNKIVETRTVPSVQQVTCTL